MSPFGLLPIGGSLITEPSAVPTETSFLYSVPATAPTPTPADTKYTSPRPQMAVFLVPNTPFPPGLAAAIYSTSAQAFATAQTQATAPPFTFIGAVGPGRESALVSLSSGDPPSAAADVTGGDGYVVGISLEPADQVTQKYESLLSASATSTTTTTTSSALVPSTASTALPARQRTIQLAQAIARNAFNFLASFSSGGGAADVVPLKAFEDWWKKFETKVRTDPSFLDRPQE